ncbi:unnamed protein product [Symbiodinium sp. KB8]|nr:unnamed protein product [Symbiodinium sp. KB8]
MFRHPVIPWLPLVGSTSLLSTLDRVRAVEMPKELRRWVMTWPSGKRSVSKMSDFDVALDPGCQQVLAPVNWQTVLEDVHAATVCLKTNEPHFGEAGQTSFPHQAIQCRNILQQSADAIADLDEIDSRYSSWKHDCYLGWLSAFLCDLVCTLHEALMGEKASREAWPLKWRKAQLELEGLFFYVELPWHVLVSQPWPVAALLARLAGALRLIDESGSTCEIRGWEHMDDALYQASQDWWRRHADAGDADTPLLPLHLAEEFLALEASTPLVQPLRCTFGVVAALLSAAIWGLKANLLDGFSDGPLAGRSLQALVSGHAQQMTKLWEERTPQFFYDLLTSRWRIPDLLDQIAALWPEPMQHPLKAAGILPTRRILFIGGGDTTYQWGSFTVRGRQMARGFRKHGVDARAWNSPCTAWCQHEHTWYPTSIVHVKYICACAVEGWPHAAHIFDPVDNFNVLDNISEMDAMLVQTSACKKDLQDHPSLRPFLNSGKIALHWLPLHHLNAHGLRITPAGTVTRVGVHTVHSDTELHDTVQRALADFSAEADVGERPEFVHLDPAQLFEHNEGKITTPQHTDAVYQQLATLQIGFAKQSGCRSEWWHCSRWKTGQRLVNMMSVGIPSIVWGDAQGHVDVVQGLWPSSDERLPQLDIYPPKLIVSSDTDVSHALMALLTNVSLRVEASAKGLKLAERFELDKVVESLDAILLDIEARKSVPTCASDHVRCEFASRHFMSRFEVTSNDRSRLHHAAEAEMAEFETSLLHTLTKILLVESGTLCYADFASLEGGLEDCTAYFIHVPQYATASEANGWLLTQEKQSDCLSGPAPRWMPLADVFCLPEEVLTTSNVRAYASQNQRDPLVRTIARLREDVTLAVALLPLCAMYLARHPFNVIRLLRLGGIHSLLALLADCSALAPGHVDAGSGDEVLTSAEISTLVLLVLAAPHSGFAPVRRFLASQCIFELLAVALRRLGRDPPERRAAAAALSPALAALAAAAASLSPFLPVEAFAPLLSSLLAPLAASAPAAFVALAASLALSARKKCELDLDQMVPRLLSLAPLEPPQVEEGCTEIYKPKLKLGCKAKALLQSALRAGAGGLGAVRAAIPLAAAVEAGEDDTSPSDWHWEVEENLCMQRTFRGTWRSRAFSMSSTAGSGAFFADRAEDCHTSPSHQMQRCSSHSMGLGGEELNWDAGCDFSTSNCRRPCKGFPTMRPRFQERPQLRIEVSDERMELSVSLGLPSGMAGTVQVAFALPGDPVPDAVLRCRRFLAPEQESAPGTLGLWICELPAAASEARKRSHQLDLRPPVHVSASSPGCKEHFVSVALPRGLYTLIPFSSHVVLDQQGVQRAKFGCRSQSCGCVDSNLMQESAWELGSRFACISAWAEATDLAVYEADPWYQRLRIEWDLLMQSLPIWLCAGTEGSMEVLICVTGPEEVVLEVPRSPGRGEELQLDLFLCIPTVAVPKKSKDVQRPKVAITAFVRQEESSRKDKGAPERLAEGVLRKELKSEKATVGSYAVASLTLCGAESRQQLFVVLQNNDPQESWPWQLRVLARIRTKEGEIPMGEATIPSAPEMPDAPPLRGAVLGGVAEPGRIYTCWPEALALYMPKRLKAAVAVPPTDTDEPQGLAAPEASHSWILQQDWDAQAPKVVTSCGTIASERRYIEPGSWPERDPAVVPEVDEQEFPDVTATLAPPARVAIVKDEGPVRSQALSEVRELKPDAEARRRPPVPLPPKRLHVRSQKDKDVAQEETETTAPEHEDLPEPTPRRPQPPGTGPVGPGDIAMPASQCERHARIEALMRRRRYGRERIMEDPHFYREGPRQQTNSLPPPRVRRPRIAHSDDPVGKPEPPEVLPLSARGERNPSLPPLPPISGEGREGRFGKPSVQKHLVRLERQPGRDRLGFGNVSAGTPQAPVLVISWIRDGALADFNYAAPEGLAVPVNSAIVSVNGISGDVQRMREALRSQVVEMEVMAPERWRYSKELDKNPEFAPPGTEAQNMELVIGWNGGQQKKDESQVPNFPQMAGLISAAEMMLKASASVALHNLVHEYATVRRSQSSQIQFEILASSPQNFRYAWESIGKMVQGESWLK